PTPPHSHTPTASPRRPAPVFGLSPEWLLHEGKPVADTLVLSHPEQLDRLRAACPEAAPTAVLAGDPCYDRILAAAPLRARFRRALGVRRGQRLVLINSTWSRASLFGDGAPAGDVLPALLSRLTAELPTDEYRIAAVLHPNIWHGHGPGQIRAWLDRARRSGLTLVDPLDGWRQALIAADAVIGDHGAVTFYAAALGTPVLLASAPLSELDPGSPTADFVRHAPRLDAAASLRRQLETLLARHTPMPGPARFTTSAPGDSAAQLRRLFYELMGADEPGTPATLERLPLPAYEQADPTAPLRVLTRLDAAAEVSVTRHPDAVHEPDSDGDCDDEVHTAVHEDTRDRDRLETADLIFRSGPPDDPRLGTPAQWTAEVLARHPHCALAAYITGPHTCTVRTRGGELLHIRARPAASAESAASADPAASAHPADDADPGGDADPAAYASAVHAWIAGGKSPAELVDGGLTMRLGDAVHRAEVSTAG
ncbi:hypothetical protein ACFQVC_41330, partial [Streptomyces monticola]